MEKSDTMNQSDFERLSQLMADKGVRHEAFELLADLRQSERVAKTVDYIDYLEAENERLRDENAKLKAQLTWRPASELPEEDQIVIATYLNSYGKRRRVMAVYIRQYEEEAGDDDELCVEYCEEKDEWYLKEGWYELIDNLGDYSSVAIVEGVVDYWMPVPPAPEGE